MLCDLEDQFYPLSCCQQQIDIVSFIQFHHTLSLMFVLCPLALSCLETMCCWCARSEAGTRYDEWTFACMCHTGEGDCFCQLWLWISFCSFAGKFVDTFIALKRSCRGMRC